MTDIKPLQKFYLGTAVKITAIISVATATTATIKIINPSSTVVVSTSVSNLNFFITYFFYTLIYERELALSIPLFFYNLKIT